jgi:hypothetical protein
MILRLVIYPLPGQSYKSLPRTRSGVRNDGFAYLVARLIPDTWLTENSKLTIYFNFYS